MRKVVRLTPICFAAVCFATASPAQTYNSFVIEVPYEFSLPAEVVTARIYCDVRADDPDREIFIRREVQLENGQARGAFKFGYANFGSSAELVPLTEEQIAFLKRATKRQDFELKVACSVRAFDHESGPEMIIVHQGGASSLNARWRAGASGYEHGPYALDQSLTSEEFIATFRAKDNGLGKPPTPPTATATAPTVSPGLQSLQSILQGE